MGRPSHPKKEVEEALRHAEARGWRVVDNCTASKRSRDTGSSQEE